MEREFYSEEARRNYEGAIAYVNRPRKIDIPAEIKRHETFHRQLREQEEVERKRKEQPRS